MSGNSDAALALRFDPDRHEYFVGDERYPSVTEVLEPEQQLDGIPPDVLERARIMGNHVHEACALLAYNRLDWATLDPLLVPRVQAARAFLKDTALTVLRVEYRMADPQLKVAGTLDLYGVLDRKTWVLDFKSGAKSRTWGLQLAAYDHLFRRNFGGRPLKRGAVQLREDGSYRLIPYEDPRDWSLFTSALNLWHWRANT
jgi:hypothetical protein